MTENQPTTAQHEQLLAMLKQYRPPEPEAVGRDIIGGRYRILLNQPLQQLSSQFADAYVVSDEMEPSLFLYALVYKNDVPIRQRNIEALKEYRHPNMVALLDYGTTEISTLLEMRFVVILERPIGQSLSSILSNGRNSASQEVLITYVLRPMVEILLSFSKMGISHNRINLENVYIANNTVMLGECVSEPSGFSQPFLFEPIERILTMPMAKSDNAIGADCYALAVLILHCLLGFKPFDGIEKDRFIESILARGTYHTLAIEWDFSDDMQDFFRGLLNDARRERWNPESLDGWLAGRHFNLILPSLPSEATRGFELLGKIYFNRKSIAYAIFRNWQEARMVIFDNKLGRWMETAAHKPDVADSVLRYVTSITNDNIRSERQNNDLLARTIILLDPSGPIRLKHLSVMLDGIGCLLTSSFLAGEREDVQTIIQMLESDLPWFWLEQQNGAGDYSAAILKLQRARNYIRINSLGFGVERCIYEMYPSLPCQSRLLKGYHVTTLAELLEKLNIVAKQRAEQDDFMDRHIGGFIASRLDMGKEVRVTELDVLPKLAANPGLVGLKLLLRAQNKVENTIFPGLCTWVALKLEPILDNIHKRAIRTNMQKELVQAVATGNLKKIERLMLNANLFINDYNNFHDAMAAYQQRREQIASLKDGTVLRRHARIVGRGVSQTVSFGVCLLTIYYTLRMYFHF
ncbi:MAG TPA: hypothetical protein VFT64_04830 [Rickettsiales bacterium]|nr:hypothetical protein [Rickettsiales bacterium]